MGQSIRSAASSDTEQPGYLPTPLNLGSHTGPGRSDLNLRPMTLPVRFAKSEKPLTRRIACILSYPSMEIRREGGTILTRPISERADVAVACARITKNKKNFFLYDHEHREYCRWSAVCQDMFPGSHLSARSDRLRPRVSAGPRRTLVTSRQMIISNGSFRHRGMTPDRTRPTLRTLLPHQSREQTRCSRHSPGCARRDRSARATAAQLARGVVLVSR